LPPARTNWAQKTCSTCGAPHPSYAAFCRHCGTRL
jgi:ribosomal protein L40E